MQLHARPALDIRRLYRPRHSLIAKTLALFASASIRLWQLTGEECYRELALDALQRLDSDRTAGQAAWGYPWDLQTRWGFNPAGSPNIVVTSFAAQAMQDAAEFLGLDSYGSRGRQAGEWVREVLWRPEARMFGYYEGSTVLVHNANLLGAALLRRLSPHDPTPDLAVSSSLADQAPDGSWPYGSGPSNMGFVDSFHTAYVLICLLTFSARDDVYAALERGARYYTSRFFDRHGRALLWPTRRFPEDGHSAGTAMTTLAALHAHGLASRTLLERVTARVLNQGLRRGHAVHRRGRLLRSTVRYIRWCDGHVALGLSHAAVALSQPELQR